MNRPGSTLRAEGTMIGRVPIARRKDWQLLLLELCDVAVQDGNDFIAVRHGERATGQEIILDIDNDQGSGNRHITFPLDYLTNYIRFCS